MLDIVLASNVVFVFIIFNTIQPKPSILILDSFISFAIKTVLSTTACDTAQGLQVIVDAIEDLVDLEESGGNVTLTSLELKLEALLNPPSSNENPFVPIVDVSITVASDDVTKFSDLMIGIELGWSFDEMKAISFDLEELLKGDTNKEITFDDFKTSLTSSAMYDLKSSVSVNLELGIQYNGNEGISDDEKVTPYLSCSSGVNLTLAASGGGEFEAAIGPLVG